MARASVTSSLNPVKLPADVCTVSAGHAGNGVGECPSAPSALLQRSSGEFLYGGQELEFDHWRRRQDWEWRASLNQGKRGRRRDWAAFLMQERWQFFLSHTFQDRGRLNESRTRQSKWVGVTDRVGRVCVQQYAERIAAYLRVALTVFVVPEYQIRGSLHYHTLWRRSDGGPAPHCEAWEWRGLWWGNGGEHLPGGRVEGMLNVKFLNHCDERAIRYVCKYVTKGESAGGPEFLSVSPCVLPPGKPCDRDVLRAAVQFQGRWLSVQEAAALRRVGVL